MPLCHNQIRGYTFPKDNASRKRWVTAVTISRDLQPASSHDNDVDVVLSLDCLEFSRVSRRVNLAMSVI